MDVAAATGLSLGAVARIERGSLRVRLTSVARVAAHYGIPVSDLLLAMDCVREENHDDSPRARRVS